MLEGWYLQVKSIWAQETYKINVPVFISMYPLTYQEKSIWVLGLHSLSAILINFEVLSLNLIPNKKEGKQRNGVI